MARYNANSQNKLSQFKPAQKSALLPKGVSLATLHAGTSILVGCILSWNRKLIWLKTQPFFLLLCYFPMLAQLSDQAHH